jgi:hypothetical protein
MKWHAPHDCFQFRVVLRNKGSTELKNWRVGFRLAEGVTIGNYWNISLSEQVASPLDWNRTILTNQQAEFGLQLAFNALPATPLELQNVSCGLLLWLLKVRIIKEVVRRGLHFVKKIQRLATFRVVIPFHYINLTRAHFFCHIWA